MKKLSQSSSHERKFQPVRNDVIIGKKLKKASQEGLEKAKGVGGYGRLSVRSEVRQIPSVSFFPWLFCEPTQHALPGWPFWP